MKCLVIDDEPKAVEILSDYIEKVPNLECAAAFRDPLKAVNYIQNNPVDLLFLDINMPDLSGIQFLNALEHHPLVIFTTAYSEYALDSYDYDAVDYLLKPIEFDRFLHAVNKAFRRYKERKKGRASLRGDRGYIFIKSGKDYHKLDTRSILYIKGTGNYLTFITPHKEIMTLLTMKEALEILPHHFHRIHKSYIINLDQVELIDPEEVKIKEERIPIGDLYREKLFCVIKRKMVKD
ncbi:MAG: response regulator transcription factor [Candidatus Aminicenantes bacterium]|nr:response regulator transcription factor [Candidatus Aminicenantes bacterium]